ncbi:MAG: hypothetical protein RID53_35900 [Coleofasciculus sp. B1-GNL1-01]|uniref:hypothetical protein n=1 Tax=Coleofasciculus sp. B1-GNL1-01 TaxID=3068484 RepID=UPI0032FF04A5
MEPSLIIKLWSGCEKFALLISTKVQQVIRDIHQRFNQDDFISPTATANSTLNPHLEIKTQYLYGKEVEIIINQGTVIGVISANKISQPSRHKLNQAGIAFAENIPKSVFTHS